MDIDGIVDAVSKLEDKVLNRLIAADRLQDNVVNGIIAKVAAGGGASFVDLMILFKVNGKEFKCVVPLDPKSTSSRDDAIKFCKKVSDKISEIVVSQCTDALHEAIEFQAIGGR